MDFSSIQDIDFQILQWFNGSNNVILDQLVMALTSGFTWIPLYLVLFIIVMRNNETIGQIGLIVGCAFLCILFADGIAEGIIKPLAARWRPSNDPLVKYSVQVVDNLRLKDYSFCSAHAANTMAIAVFFSLLVRSRMLTFTRHPKFTPRQPQPIYQSKIPKILFRHHYTTLPSTEEPVKNCQHGYHNNSYHCFNHAGSHLL